MNSLALGAPARFPVPGSQPGLSAKDRDLPIWPIVFVIYMTLTPREMRITIGGSYIFLDRLAMYASLPWVILCIWRGLIKFVLPDWLVLFAAIWSIVAMVHAYGPGRGLITGGSYAFDSICGYYLARVSFRSLHSIRRALILCAPGFLISGLSVMVESISHQFIIRPALSRIFGALVYRDGSEIVAVDFDKLSNVRLGLMRGLGPWPHPILAGLHLATLLPIYWLSGIRGWPRTTALLASFCAIFTVSSAAFAALFMGLAMISYDYISRIWREISWQLFFYVMGTVMALVQVATNSGVIGFIIRYGALDKQTGYYRQLIWQYGTLTVSHHPLFGIGYEPYERLPWMTSSVDNHWLLWAIRYGLPAALSLFAACIVTMWAVGRSIGRAQSFHDVQFFKGILMTLVTLVLMMFTVAIQGGTLTWFALMLGGCVACAQQGFFRKGPAPLPLRRQI